MAVDTVHQCPQCELRFAFRPELEDHLRWDHQPVPDDDLLATAPARAGTVIVPVDPTRSPTLAISIAASLARQAGLDVELVAVPPLGLTSDAYLRARVEEAIAAGAPEARGNLLVTTGAPAAAIVDRAERADAVLVCMATHGRGRVGNVVLGSVSAAVVRRSSVPVLLVGPVVSAAGDRVRRLVTCLDGSELAERAVPAAAELAHRLDAEVVLVRVVPHERARPGPGACPDLEYLHNVAERIPDLPVAVELVHDREPAQAIARYVSGREHSVVVMGTHGRSGLQELVLGSVARGVIHRADCPVLVVPPRAVSYATPSGSG
jgi:nucleotide-binding universal stress UspA family protein